MSKVRFRTGDVDLELTGSEPFVVRQLRLLSSCLGEVDTGALEEAAAITVAPAPVYSHPEPDTGSRPTNGGTESRLSPDAFEVKEGNDGQARRPPDELMAFFRSFTPSGRDRQTDAALLFAYFLQRREGLASLELKDLIRCCIRAGVDTRNFNRTLGTLTRRGFLQTVRHGQAYRLSNQGVAAVESRM